MQTTPLCWLIQFIILIFSFFVILTHKTMNVLIYSKVRWRLSQHLWCKQNWERHKYENFCICCKKKVYLNDSKVQFVWHDGDLFSSILFTTCFFCVFLEQYMWVSEFNRFLCCVLHYCTTENTNGESKILKRFEKEKRNKGYSVGCCLLLWQ